MKLEDTTQEKKEIFLEEEIAHHFEDSKYQIHVQYGHYVLEYWHMNQKNPEEIGRWQSSHMIKSRESYQIPDYVFAFQFYDLIRVEVNGEIMEGRNPHHESPIIYVGERVTLESDSESLESNNVIIDRDGDIHFGNSGITCQEYLEALKEKNPNCRRMRLPNLRKK